MRTNVIVLSLFYCLFCLSVNAQNDTLPTSLVTSISEQVEKTQDIKNPDQERADSVISKIDKIGKVENNPTCKKKIQDARDAYEALSADLKGLVTNYNKLSAAEKNYNSLEKLAYDTEKAKKVIEKINSIGEVEYPASHKKIKNAKDAYEALSADQKRLVTNYDKLSVAEDNYTTLENQAIRLAYDTEEANKVIEIINSIGEVEYNQASLKKIKKAREAYDALSASQKGLVTNYFILTNNEHHYQTLANNDAANRNQDAAGGVIRMISDIGEVVYSDDCNARIKAAREAYDELSPSQKDLVKNINSLEIAEKQYEDLKKEHENKELQEMIKNKNRDKAIRYSSMSACLAIVIGVVVIVARKRRKKKMENVVIPSSIESNNKTYKKPQREDKKDLDTILSQQRSTIHKEDKVTDAENDKVVNQTPVMKPTISKNGVAVSAEWIVVGASVKGNGHIQSNMPCQDNSMFESLDSGWGIAIVSDGAGSAAHSDLGSKIVVTRGIFHFKKLIENERWIEKKTLPTDVEWLQKSYAVLKDIRTDVMMVAKKNNTDIKALSATCLVVIYSPFGLLTVHVGDGRMGYKTLADEWKPMMTPHKGEEANQTIFLVSDFWSIPQYTMSGVLVPESMVIREPVKAFALMSDGCENTAWLCTALNSETGKYYDRNLPFAGFFNPLEETLLTFNKENVPVEARQAKWFKFIESGISGFVKEQDDKTMIYAVNIELIK